MASGTNDPLSVKSAKQSSGMTVFPPELKTAPIHFNINIVSYQNSPGFTSNNVGASKFSVYLPLPEGLTDAFHVEYEDHALGTLGGIVSTTKNIINNPEGIAGAASSAAKSLIMGGINVGTEALGAALGQSGGQKSKALGSILGQSGGTISAATELGFGAIQNPNIAVLFKGINIRKHNFKWKFTFKNAAESTTFRELVKNIKKSALPSLDKGQTLLLDYPDVAMLSIVGLPEGIINFSAFGTFIESISATPASGNISLFNDSSPVEMVLEMTFRERNIVTSGDIK